MGFISLDYADALLQVSRLENAADQCDDAAKAVKSAYSEVCNSWEGAAAEVFKQKLKEWERENSDIEDELYTIAKRIKKVAQSIKEADERAAASFE